MLSQVDVAVLAGGLGTRLRGAIEPGTPKVMALIAGRPFLDHLLTWLRSQGARRVLLCLGHRAAAVETFLSAHNFEPLQVDTVVEPKPLGTAGAIAFARPRLTTDPVLVLNGDTFVEVNLNEFLNAHQAGRAEISMLGVWVDHAGRYGRLQLDEQDRVISYDEKDPTATGPNWINAGVYLFKPSALDKIALLTEGSLERDVLAKTPARSIQAYKTRGRFIDIGTPETLDMATAVLQP